MQRNDYVGWNWEKKYISVDTNLKLSTLSDAVCLGQDFKEFFKETQDFSTCEYYLPNILDNMMKEGLEIKVLPTTSIWKGVTYKTDLDDLKEHIKQAIEAGEYPNNLWG